MDATLAIQSLNCNGLNDESQRKQIFHTLLTSKCHITLLQETHVTAQNVNRIEKEWKRMGGTHAFFSPMPDPTTVNGKFYSTGVAILFHGNFEPKFSSPFIDDKGRIVSIKLTHNNTQYTVY